MLTFKDDQGREWSTRITWSTSERLAENQILLGEIEQLVAPFEMCMPVLYDALWLTCCEQAKEAGVTKEQFCDALYGDVLGEARDALLAGIMAFFPKDRREKTLLMHQLVKEEITKTFEENSLREKLSAALESAASPSLES